MVSGLLAPRPLPQLLEIAIQALGHWIFSKKRRGRCLRSLSPLAAMEALTIWRPTMKHLTTTERREQAGDVLTKGIFRVLANQATQAYAKKKEVPVKTKATL
jgi:hypothetical protein